MNRGARETGRTFGEIVKQLDEELSRCAASRWGDPVAFTWRARRCGEAMLLALLTRDTDTRPTHRDLDAMLKDKRLEAPQGPLSRDARNRLEILQRYGNTAAHWQLDAIDHASNAADTAHALVWLVRWFYRDVVKGERPSVAEALRAMEHRPTPAPPAPAAPAPAPPRPLPVALASGFVGAVLGGLLLWRLTPVPQASTERPDAALVAPPVALPQPTRVRVEAPVAPPVAPEPSPPETPRTQPPPPTPATRTGCPEGYVYVSPLQVTIAPPIFSGRDRADWPPLLSRDTSAQREEGFCIQAEMEASSDGTRSRPARLSHAEATAACARQGGTLPTVWQWESIARQPERLSTRIRPWQGSATGNLEWVADGFPAAFFHRGAPRPGDWHTRGPIPPQPYRAPYPLQSWNHHSEGRDPHIGFRCVVPLR